MTHCIPTAPVRATRIAIVLHDFPAGGTERIAIRLAGAWAREGRDVTILCGSEAGPARSLVPAGVRVIEQDPPIPRGTVSRVQLGRAIARDLRETPRYDILVAPGNFHLPVLVALAGACPRARRPVLVCKLSNPLRRPDRGRIGRWLFTRAKRRLTRPVDSLVAMSETLRVEAGEVLARHDIAVLAEPILTESPAAPDIAQCTGSPLVVVVGRLVPQKRVSLALRAFAMLGQPGARLAVLGDGPQRAMLETLAVRLGLRSRCRFEGHVADVGGWLARADLLLSTSRFEGYPAVLVEAIAAGVPVVTTASSVAISEIVRDEDHGLVAAADPMQLAEAMARVLSRGGVPDAARRVIHGRHGEAECAAAWLSHLDTLVAARAR